MDSLFYKMCRICASEAPKMSVNMFSETGQRHQLPDKIRLCLPISVDEDDKLPKEICSSCLYKLDMCNDLYHVSVTAQNILKSKLESILYEQSQYLEELRSNSVSRINNAEVIAKSPSQSQGSKQIIMKKRLDCRDAKEDEDILMRLEQPNSSVILQDIVVKLTSVENPSLKRPSMPEISDDEKSFMPGIIVTDITGVPFASHSPAKEFIMSLPPEESIMDLTDEKHDEPNSCSRMTDKRNTEGGDGKCSPIDTSNRKEGALNNESIQGSKLKDFRATKKKLDDDISKQGEVKDNSFVEINGGKYPSKHKSELRNKLLKFRPSKKKSSSSSFDEVKCKICLKRFSKDIIDHHRRLHLKESVYSCVDCGKNFSTDEVLSTHSCGQS